MQKSMVFQHIYCLFCRSGSERQLARELEIRFPRISAIAAMQEKHKYINGRYEIDRRSFLPGYLFLYTNEEIDVLSIHRMDKAYKVLGDGHEIAELRGRDRVFAEWIWKNGGEIGISRLRIKEDGFEVVSGPLQHFLKEIVKIDKHTRNALVRMDFLEEQREIWLAFEFEDDGENNGEVK